MKWTRVDPPKRRAWTHGRYVICTPIYVSDAGYQIAFADLLDSASGWALWRRLPGGFRRLVPSLHLATPEEAFDAAALEHLRLSFVAGLPLRAAAIGLLLTKRLVGAAHVDAVIDASSRRWPAPGLLARYINAMTEEVPSGQANKQRRRVG